MMFTQAQLDSIKVAASRTKNQGELAVISWFMTHPDKDTFDRGQYEVLKYCAEECKRQMSGEMSVYDMVNAWNFAYLSHNYQYTLNSKDYISAPHITKEFIEEVGKLVEPFDNRNGIRKMHVYVGAFEKEIPEFIHKDLDVLLYLYYEGVLKGYPNLNFLQGGATNEALWDMQEKQDVSEIDMFYYYYEMIHPFIDGNGRSGKILYNYLCGTLENPILPPNFWNSSNP